MTAAVILENFGGPETAAEVEGFLYHLFADPDVIQLPFGPRFQKRLARRTSTRRAPIVAKDYEAIGGSPLKAMTYAQRDAISAALRERLGDEAPPLYVGMSYTPPFLDEAVGRALDDGADRLVALPLFPHYSFTTTGSVHNRVAESLVRRGARKVPVSYVPGFFDHPGWVAAVTDRIREALANFPEDLRPRIHLVFSAHGLPARYVRKGDPYMRQVQESVRSLVRALDWPGPWTLAWQSRVGPLKWLDPPTDETLLDLARRGTPILVAPVSFVGDHIETLWEIDRLYRGKAEAAGAPFFAMARGLDLHPAFIDGLADLVVRALGGAFDALCFRCLLPRDRRLLGTAACLDCHTRRPFYDRLWRTEQDLARGL